MKREKTLVLFSYDWDAIEFGRLAGRWPQLTAGFDLFSFPSNLRLAWFDMERFSRLAALRARLAGARGVVSNHEQFGALCAALVAERTGWPGTPVEAVLACQHKLHAREILQRVAPEANVPFCRLETEYGGDIPEQLAYPSYVKPVKAAFSVLAKQVGSRRELVEHTRFESRELWVIRHLVEPFEKIALFRLPDAGSAHSLMLEKPLEGPQYCLDGYFYNGQFRKLGVVDSVMYPGTDAFMRFDYPSRLSGALQREAEQVAIRFMQAIGFNHGLFNMEFIHDRGTGRIKVIEFNPRMASQFSDLYTRVDGVNLHQVALVLEDLVGEVAAGSEPYRGNGNTDLRSTTAPEQLALRVFGSYVGDLVADDCRQLVLVLCRLEDAFVDNDFAAGHDERIDLVRLDNRHLPVVITVRRFEHLDNGVGHTGDVGDGIAVGSQGRRSLDLGELASGLGFQFAVRLGKRREHGMVQEIDSARQHQRLRPVNSLHPCNLGHTPRSSVPDISAAGGIRSGAASGRFRPSRGRHPHLP